MIPLPTSIEVSDEKSNKATITVMPCYPGYGNTLGNALRRVLLSSLPGAAITDVTIKNADHEFTSIENVKEDVVSIILNMKLVRLKIQGDEPLTIQLKEKGAKTVKAKDFILPSQVEIVNGEQEIATITEKNGTLEIEATVMSGRGYIPVENREKENKRIGTIEIDSVYTPVITVNFTVEHVRVEQMTNFDKLTIEITTDGTISPKDAFKQAAKILFEHFSFLGKDKKQTKEIKIDKEQFKEENLDNKDKAAIE